MKPVIVGVSDVAVGYGSPQVSMLMRSLSDWYGGEAVLLEPEETREPKPARLSALCAIERISLPESPGSEVARAAFIHQAAKRIEGYRPEVLVVVCSYTVPVLLRLKTRPRLTIYLAIESIVAYGERDVSIHRHVRDWFDMVLFPEENRARLDMERCGLSGIPVAIVFNAATPRGEIEPASKREGSARMLYSGTIDRDETLAHYFLDSRVRQRSIDLYGKIVGRAGERLCGEIVASSTSGLRYRGYVAATELARLRPGYSFSIVMWAPTNENRLYAAPNKFFEAIADGVPPIVAPHPQCKMLVERYDCGIVMRDFGLEAFVDALDEAAGILGTPRYDELVQNCQRAARRELNWDVQFEKVVRLLPATAELFAGARA